jgi:hypothetical protein
MIKKQINNFPQLQLLHFSSGIARFCPTWLDKNIIETFIARASCFDGETRANVQTLLIKGAKHRAPQQGRVALSIDTLNDLKRLIAPNILK